VLCWDQDQPEPWLLATTLNNAAQARRSYRLRMGVEELFKDLKGRFCLEACQAQTLARLTRLCLFLTLALWALTLLVRYPQSLAPLHHHPRRALLPLPRARMAGRTTGHSPSPTRGQLKWVTVRSLGS
jgi:hypothetical protein